MSSFSSVGQEVSLANGDTNNPFVLCFKGLGSTESSVRHLKRVLDERQPLAEFVAQTEELLEVVDTGTSELVNLYPESSVAHDLAVQWAILVASPMTPNNFEAFLQTLRIKAKPYEEWEPVRLHTELFDMYVRTAIIYDMLLTRMMTQIKSGGHGVREMMQGFEGP